MTSFVDDDGNYLDYAGEDFYLTKQIISIFDMDLKGDVSINFTLSGNSLNRKALGYVGIQQTSNPAFSQQAFTVIRNGNNIMKGFIVIQRDLGTELDCFFISGNANWFEVLKFSCRDIRNPDYTVFWDSQTGTGIGLLSGIRSGICFPVIDWWSGGQRFSQYFGNVLLRQAASDVNIQFLDLFPCLFVHTLLEEIAKVADIRLAGSLLTDGTFKNLIVTPGSPDITDPATGFDIVPNMAGVVTSANTSYVTIGAIAPDMKALDLVKWLVVSFGCLATYDIYTKTLTLDLSIKRKKEDAKDWSEYLKSFTVDYDRINQHNYIRSRQGPEKALKAYNENTLLKYGELDIQSLKTDGSEKTLYESPFCSVKDVIGTSNFAFATPDCKLFQLEDGPVYNYTGVTNSAGKVRFDGAGFPFGAGGGATSGIIVRVVSDLANHWHDGYHFTDGINGGSAIAFYAQSDYLVGAFGDTGKLYTQRITKLTPGPRMLICAPGTDTNMISAKDSIGIGPTTSPTTYGNVMYAYYSKVKSSAYPDSFNKALNYGEINLRFYYATSLSESYFNYFKRWVTSPYIRAKFLLPEAVFREFEFQFVYLNTYKISGYYMVGRIFAYKDSRHEVEVEIYKCDG